RLLGVEAKERLSRAERSHGLTALVANRAAAPAARACWSEAYRLASAMASRSPAASFLVSVGAPARARPARCAAQLAAEGLRERHGPGARHELHAAHRVGLRREPDGLQHDRIEDGLCRVEDVAGSGREYDEPAPLCRLPGAEHGTV